MKPRVLFCLLLAVIAFSHSTFGAAAPATPPAPLPDGLYAEITTRRGVITAELFFTQAPLTVTNFVGLAEGTLGPEPRKPFFNGLKFHRVAPDFVIQGGDPLGTGEGGPGYSFPDEFVPGLRHATAGTLSMANSGADTNGSQFFITLRETNRLNYLHSVFGRVVRGAEILPKIQANDLMAVRILRQGAAAENFRADPATFAALIAKAKVHAPLPPGRPAHFEDPSDLLPIDPSRAKVFDLKLANVERATGVKIYGRLVARAPATSDDRRLNEHLRELATPLGLLKEGALVVYYANRHEWKLWLGDDTAAAFMGHAGSVKDFMQDGAFHLAKQDFFEKARTAGSAALARANQNSSIPPSSSQILKHQVDAVLDSLIFKLEPR